jgi:type III pantothenate kinase
MFANTTAQAIENGALFALAAAADRAAVELARQTHTERPQVYVTGGDAERIRGAMLTPAEVVPDLVLRGLAVWGRCAGERKPGVESRA